MLVITADRLPHDTGTVLSEALDDCESEIVFLGEPALAEQLTSDPVHHVLAVIQPVQRAHV